MKPLARLSETRHDWSQKGRVIIKGKSPTQNYQEGRAVGLHSQSVWWSCAWVARKVGKFG